MTESFHHNTAPIGIIRSHSYKNGMLKDATLNKKNIINTEYGGLIPRFTAETGREKQTPSVSFYESGAIKKIALQEQSPIETAIGTFPAELVTFYENGNLHRLFPLNGQISGFWTEEQEASLAEEFSFSFPFGTFRAKIIGLSFYDNGSLKSFTLWPDETILIKTPLGPMPIKNGFSLHKNGAIQSTEPAEPYKVSSPIGSLRAFDKENLGIHADTNSLRFKKDGTLHGLIISDQKISCKTENAMVWTEIIPTKKMHPMLDGIFTNSPIALQFDDDTVTISGEKTRHLSIKNTAFLIETIPNTQDHSSCGGTDCSNCPYCD